MFLQIFQTLYSRYSQGGSYVEYFYHKQEFLLTHYNLSQIQTLVFSDSHNRRTSLLPAYVCLSVSLFTGGPM